MGWVNLLFLFSILASTMGNFVTGVGVLGFFRKRIVYKNEGSTTFSNKFLNHKKVITLSPGGFKGFHMMGTCKFIKENYCLENYVFSGASAGAWNCLVLSYKGESEHLEKVLLDGMFSENESLKMLELGVKERLLKNFNSDDFEIEKIFIGTTVFQNFKFKTVIHYGFEDLNDVIDCCIASSHIPFITGGLKFRYKGLANFDGGFSEFPYINNTKAMIHITPSIWSNDTITFSGATLNPQNLTTIKNMINKGYSDAELNRDKLDKLFNF
tara:strand:- start:326 stop:1132 length:807 start_codon:yes stop_codon:yes gene_type:complete